MSEEAKHDVKIEIFVMTKAKLKWSQPHISLVSISRTLFGDII